MGDVIPMNKKGAGASPNPINPALAGESEPSPDSPAHIHTEAALHEVRRVVDMLYASASTDPQYLEALRDNRGFIGPIIRQLLECNRITEANQCNSD